VAVYDFSPISEATKSSVGPCCVLAASSEAIRTVYWSPSEPWLLATGGHDGKLRVWDVRDPHFPLLCKHVARGWVLSLIWFSPQEVMFGTDGAAVQILNLVESQVRSVLVHKAAVWGIAMDGDDMVLSASADGCVKSSPIATKRGGKISAARNNRTNELVFSVSPDGAGLAFGCVKHEGHINIHDALDCDGIAWHSTTCSAMCLGEYIWRAAVGSGGVLAISKAEVQLY